MKNYMVSQKRFYSTFWRCKLFEICIKKYYIVSRTFVHFVFLIYHQCFVVFAIIKFLLEYLKKNQTETICTVKHCINMQILLCYSINSCRARSTLYWKRGRISYLCYDMASKVFDPRRRNMYSLQQRVLTVVISPL